VTVKKQEKRPENGGGGDIFDLGLVMYILEKPREESAGVIEREKYWYEKGEDKKGL
jgi:hypothetical protein